MPWFCNLMDHTYCICAFIAPISGGRYSAFFASLILHKSHCRIPHIIRLITPRNVVRPQTYMGVIVIVNNLWEFICKQMLLTEFIVK